MQNLTHPYAKLAAPRLTSTRTPLLGDPRFADAWHCWSDAEVKAVVQAWASRRPLLVRGEAGCGKSQLARAVAACLAVPLEVQVIHPRFEATDLLYHYDFVQRLAQAQLMAALRSPGDHSDVQTWLADQLAPRQFVRPGAIWRAMQHTPPADANAAYPRAVVLIDEIDKADIDVPNTLLDVLGNRSFTVPMTGETVSCTDGHQPLILITTNEDRELPAAFVRRCAVLNLKPQDESESAFAQWLIERASAHEDLAVLAPATLNRAAQQVWADRQDAARLGLPTVGLAEYLDLLYALLRVAGANAAQQDQWLDQLSPFALVKHRDQQQNRQGVAREQA